ncbi:MAG: hypothetical protein FJY82_15250 [Candidatus Aminicenantes bacterium]|nr:hypothetical protein [Candidatus Aminicenantes bacterium]
MSKRSVRFPALLAGLLALLSCRAESDVASSNPAAAPPAPAPPERKAVPLDGAVNETLKFLAGLPSDSESYRPLRETPAWQDYARGLEANWAAVEEARLKPMTAWAEAELAEAFSSAKTVFYPFGGPDFITAFRLFPKAETYILLGLEAVGNLPALLPMTPAQIEGYLALMNAALADFFMRSYFITGHMDASLPQLDGVLPVVAFFLARSGNAVVSVRRVDFTAEGGLVETPYPSLAERAGRPKGIRVDFVAAGTDSVRTLYYFSGDLEDPAFLPESPFHRYLNGLPEVTTFIKSASYLLHYGSFSRVRNIILSKSRHILEDDTGIPYKYFGDGWKVQLYGVYEKPIKDFSNVDQPDLAEAYLVPGAAKALPFSLGYHWRSRKDNLLFIRRD